jgi:hypothetical protein
MMGDAHSGTRWRRGEPAGWWGALKLGPNARPLAWQPGEIRGSELTPRAEPGLSSPCLYDLFDFAESHG